MVPPYTKCHYSAKKWWNSKLIISSKNSKYLAFPEIIWYEKLSLLFWGLITEDLVGIQNNYHFYFSSFVGPCLMLKCHFSVNNYGNTLSMSNIKAIIEFSNLILASVPIFSVCKKKLIQWLLCLTICHFSINN